jgi:hypothetical protein
VPSEYEPTREPLSKKMFFKRQRHPMGKNSRAGEVATVAENAPQRENAREEARWSARARVLSKVKMPWHLRHLSAVLVLSAFLDLSRLRSEGYANVYYAATVKDMLDSWYNFFVSYDAGFVSVDKPLWGSGYRRPALICLASTGGVYCSPRRSRGFFLWPCSTTWCTGASGRWQGC